MAQTVRAEKEPSEVLLPPLVQTADNGDGNKSQSGTGIE